MKKKKPHLLKNRMKGENRVKQLEEENKNLKTNMESLQMIYNFSCGKETHLKWKFF